MEGEVGDPLPLGVLFAPDEDLAVIAGGGEDVAVFWVSLIIKRGGPALEQCLGAW